jgi:hypothetical protein
MRAERFLLVTAVAACGGGHHASPDAYLPPPCDYVEASDATNAATPETTNVSIGDLTRDLCGTVDHGHYDPASGVVDVDVYRVTVSPTSADLVVQFFGGQGSAGLEDFSVLVFDTATPNHALINGAHFDPANNDHGVFVSTLPAGTYDIVVAAHATADLPASVDYKVRIGVEQRAQTCAIGTKPGYTEANDGADSHGNDVVAVDFSKAPAFAAAAGSAEATGLMIDEATPVELAGTSANVGPGSDQYLDRDTFRVTTSATANELVLRLGWTGAGADLDEVVFADPATPATEIGYSTDFGSDGTAGELARIAVKPGTSYLVWVGATKASTGMPVPYNVELCGVTVDTSVARN